MDSADLSNLPKLELKEDVVRNLIVLSFGIILLKLIEQNLFPSYSLSLNKIKKTIKELNETNTEEDIINKIIGNKKSLYHRIFSSNSFNLKLAASYDACKREGGELLPQVGMLSLITHQKENLTHFRCLKDYINVVFIRDRKDKKKFTDNANDMLNSLINLLKGLSTQLLVVARFKYKVEAKHIELSEYHPYITDQNPAWCILENFLNMEQQYNIIQEKDSCITVTVLPIAFLIIVTLANVFAWANVFAIVSLTQKIIVSCIGNVIGVGCLIGAIVLGCKYKICVDNKEYQTRTNSANVDQEEKQQTQEHFI